MYTESPNVSQMQTVEIIIRTAYYEAYTESSQSKCLLVRVFESDAVPGGRSSSNSEWRIRQTDEDEAEDDFVDDFVEADEKALTRWKRKVGMLVVRDFVKPEVQRRGLKWRTDMSMLVDFPAGYTLYMRRKGDKTTTRKDYYLRGSSHVRQFRSPDEFYLHLIWLMSGQPRNAHDKRLYVSRRHDELAQGAVGQAEPALSAKEIVCRAKDYRKGVDVTVSA
ncbi:hypothetical protein EIP91_007665 [Steccherinum ochraceum]|uniref:Cryptic loci regulator 2 N-terminal domain-containing protein n=1 Tax=Steccherinum ochraceum TaxID=92696 RepID=A0A4V2MVC5_9APHY|nr:hypothetical protein EIP91_007665 [Steccherinum ochraceum]